MFHATSFIILILCTIHNHCYFKLIMHTLHKNNAQNPILKAFRQIWLTTFIIQHCWWLVQIATGCVPVDIPSRGRGISRRSQTRGPSEWLILGPRSKVEEWHLTPPPANLAPLKFSSLEPLAPCAWMAPYSSCSFTFFFVSFLPFFLPFSSFLAPL